MTTPTPDEPALEQWLDTLKLKRVIGDSYLGGTQLVQLWSLPDEIRAKIKAKLREVEREARIEELDRLPNTTGIFDNGYYETRVAALKAARLPEKGGNK